MPQKPTLSMNLRIPASVVRKIRATAKRRGISASREAIETLVREYAPEAANG